MPESTPRPEAPNRERSMTRGRDPLGHIAVLCAVLAGLLLLFSQLVPPRPDADPASHPAPGETP
jgi:hypothetical protein